MYHRFELIAIAPGKFTEEESDKIYKEYTKMIDSISVNSITAESWGNKRLAYPITGMDSTRHKTGWYYLFEFSTTSERLEDIEKYINTDDHIIKHIIVRKDDDVDVTREEDRDLILPDYSSEQHRQESTVNALDVLLGLASYEYAKQEGEKK